MVCDPVAALLAEPLLAAVALADALLDAVTLGVAVAAAAALGVAAAVALGVAAAVALGVAAAVALGVAAAVALGDALLAVVALAVAPDADPPGAQPLIARPATDTELPQTVIGTSTGMSTWLPPSTEWLPEVVCDAVDALLVAAPPAEALLADAAGMQPLMARPSTAAALPQTATGTLTGMSTWLPPSTEWLPEVVCDPVDALADAPPADPLWAEALPVEALDAAPPGAHPLIARPATDTEFPQAVTGAFTGTSTWLPPSTEWLPDVVWDSADALLAAEPVADAAGSHPPSARPSTAMALPQRATDAFTGASTWLPPATEWLPVVVPATASPVPPTANTVVKRANLAVLAAHVNLLI